MFDLRCNQSSLRTSSGDQICSNTFLLHLWSSSWIIHPVYSAFISNNDVNFINLTKYFEWYYPQLIDRNFQGLECRRSAHNFFVCVNLTKISSNITFSATTVIIMKSNGYFLEKKVIARNVMETHKEEKPYRLYH